MTRLTNDDAMRIAAELSAREYLATPAGEVAADSIPELIDRAQGWALVCRIQGYDEWSTRGPTFRRLADELAKARAVIAELEQFAFPSTLGDIYSRHDFDPGQGT